MWDHFSFRRSCYHLQRAGIAAMITLYGARAALPKHYHVVRLHGEVAGCTPDGITYQANDIALLNWVQAPASFGFVESSSPYAQLLSDLPADYLYRREQY